MRALFIWKFTKNDLRSYFYVHKNSLQRWLGRSPKWLATSILTFTKIAYCIDLNVHKNYLRPLFWRFNFTKIAYSVDLNVHQNDLRSLFWRSQTIAYSIDLNIHKTWLATFILTFTNNSLQHRLEYSQKMTYDLYFDVHKNSLQHRLERYTIYQIHIVTET